jgi:hypothetical protein
MAKLQKKMDEDWEELLQVRLRRLSLTWALFCVSHMSHTCLTHVSHMSGTTGGFVSLFAMCASCVSLVCSTTEAKESYACCVSVGG